MLFTFTNQIPVISYIPITLAINNKQDCYQCIDCFTSIPLLHYHYVFSLHMKIEKNPPLTISHQPEMKEGKEGGSQREILALPDQTKKERRVHFIHTR